MVGEKAAMDRTSPTEATLAASAGVASWTQLQGPHPWFRSPPIALITGGPSAVQRPRANVKPRVSRVLCAVAKRMLVGIRRARGRIIWAMTTVE